MDIQPITVSGPIVPETMTHAVGLSGLSFEWLLSAGLWIAIFSFIVRELLEWYKKYRDRRRKIEVYRSAVEYYINRNRAALLNLREFYKNIDNIVDGYKIEKVASGRFIIRPKELSGAFKTKKVSDEIHFIKLEMPNFDPESLDKLAIEIGMIDPQRGDIIRGVVTLLYQAKNFTDDFIDLEKERIRTIIVDFWRKSDNLVSDLDLNLLGLAGEFELKYISVSDQRETPQKP